MATAICIDSDGESSGPQACKEELLCKLLLPSCRSDSDGSLKPLSGSFCVNLVAGDLELRQHGGLRGLRSSVPVALVTGIEVSQDGSSVLLRLRSDMLLQGLFAVPVDMLGLQPVSVDLGAVLTTLRWWLPHVAVHATLLAVSGPSQVPNFLTLRWDGIELTARDIDLLGKGKCLNDSVVDFFLKLVLEVMAPPDLRERLLLTSTFFFQKLTSGRVGSGDEGWHNVRRWRHGNLKNGPLSQDYLVVPINEQNLHWWMVVVCFPYRALPLSPSSDAQLMEGHRPRLVCLDSAAEPPPHERTVSFLRGYLWREWQERTPEMASLLEGGMPKSDRMLNILSVDADVPKQTNGYDCGVFIIEFLLKMCRSPAALLGLGLAPHKHWFDQTAVNASRHRLKSIAALLRQMAARQSDSDVGRLLQDDSLRKRIQQVFSIEPEQLEKRASKSKRAPSRQDAEATHEGRPPKRRAAEVALERAKAARLSQASWRPARAAPCAARCS